MRLIRIYLNQNYPLNALVTLNNQSFKHLIKVLRLKVNDTFILFNGDGNDYHAIITEIQKKHLSASIFTVVNVNNESPINISLYQAISKSDHMDWTVQKAIELGVNTIVPFYSQRTQGRFKDKAVEKKQLHWGNIAISASEQSGRASICKIKNISDFNTVLAELRKITNKYVFDFDSSAIKLSQMPSELKSISIICGPEGGFNPEEIQLLKSISTEIVTLGPRVLRTETASISAISILQYKYGDL